MWFYAVGLTTVQDALEQDNVFQSLHSYLPKMSGIKLKSNGHPGTQDQKDGRKTWGKNQKTEIDSWVNTDVGVSRFLKQQLYSRKLMTRRTKIYEKVAHGRNSSHSQSLLNNEAETFQLVLRRQHNLDAKT